MALRLARCAADALHPHTTYEERLFVLSGGLTVWTGQDKLTLQSGDFRHLPTDVST